MQSSVFSIVGTLLEKVADEVKVELQRDSQATQAVKIGEADSLVAKSRSQIFSSMRVVKPKVGSILAVGLGFGVIDHTGVYIGKGYVIEQHGDDALKKVTFKEFMDGDGEIYARGLNTNIQIACNSKGKPLAKKRVAEYAEKLYDDYERRTQEYSIFFNNCHQFCWKCLKPDSDDNLLLFSTLEESIAKEYGYVIYWDKIEI